MQEGTAEHCADCFQQIAGLAEFQFKSIPNFFSQSLCSKSYRKCINHFHDDEGGMIWTLIYCYL
jgi:hypothetical protein